MKTALLILLLALSQFAGKIAWTHIATSIPEPGRPTGYTFIHHAQNQSASPIRFVK